MARDLLKRPPLRVSEMPPAAVRLYPGEARAVACPECGRWQVPHDGGLRYHTIGVDSTTACVGIGRRVWFDLTCVEWQARLRVAVREAAGRRSNRVRRVGRPPTAVPVFRLAAR